MTDHFAFTPRPWSDEDIATVRRLTADGWSGSQIGKKLHRTRNAVIGIRHRLGIDSVNKRLGDAARDAKRTSRVPGATKRPAPKAAAPRLPPKARPVEFRRTETVDDGPELVIEVADVDAFDPLPGSAPVPFEDRGTDRCCWPIDAANDEVMSCNEPAHGPYCSSHARLAYKPTQKLKLPAKVTDQGYGRRLVA